MEQAGSPLAAHGAVRSVGIRRRTDTYERPI